jgi:Uma2 family endonuclease
MATSTMMTSAEFLARPDEFEQSGNRIKDELIGGEIVRKAEPSSWHDVTKNNIGDALAFHLWAHGELGLRSLIEIAFKVTEHDTFRPDVSVVRTERLAEEGRILKGAPEIAVEVISPTDTVDKIREKIAAHLENGASSVWIFYRDGLVSVHTATGVRELKGDQPLEDPLLPGFSVPVSAFYFRP